MALVESYGWYGPGLLPQFGAGELNEGLNVKTSLLGADSEFTGFARLQFRGPVDVSAKTVRRMFKVDQVFAVVNAFLNADRIGGSDGMSEVSCSHKIFDRYEVVSSSDAKTEILRLATDALSSFVPAKLRDLRVVFARTLVEVSIFLRIRPAGRMFLGRDDWKLTYHYVAGREWRRYWTSQRLAECFARRLDIKAQRPYHDFANMSQRNMF